jgi:indolepyruvate ferredoxin oxidoreductase, alpha subunit
MTAHPAWNLDEPGKQCMLSGNEAAARGAIEAGVRVVASYPGSPSVQILECLAKVARDRNMYAEWSINEKVALEVAAAASFAGLRALSIMKADGLNVALDFLTTLPLSGILGGLVLIVSDDPGAHSSVKEEDTRYLAPPAHVPLLEPSDPQDTRDMLVWAFEMSEKTRLPIMLRLVTRICHARGIVRLNPIRRDDRKPHFTAQPGFITAARFHARAHERLQSLQADFESSVFNTYNGPTSPELTIVTSGVSHYYAREAVQRLAVGERVGILRVGTPWPLPERLVLDVLKHSRRILFLEEIEPFLEEQTKILAAGHWDRLGPLTFLGKQSGDVPWRQKSRGMGEMDPDIATEALAKVLGIDFASASISPEPADRYGTPADLALPQRLPNFCAGCPHRASYWAIKTALALDNRDGFALGDIGCYALGVMPTGYNTIATVHSMGSGAGLAAGFGKLGALGLRQPVVAVIGDSTFYHSGIAPLLNARTTGADYLCIVLDNGTTAMTGHQPHPGCAVSAMGDPTVALPIADLIRNLGIPLTVKDPYDVHGTVAGILDLLNQGGLQVLLLQRACSLQAGKQNKTQRAYVDPHKCRGDECGCARLCSRIFSCPANIWDDAAGCAAIDDVLCTGCGVCAALCPQGAIAVEHKGDQSG